MSEMSSTTTTEPKGTAAVLTEPYGRPYTFKTHVATLPSEGEALVRLDYSGVCHGDVYMRDGGGPAPPTPRRPLIGGHEGVGTVMALGPGADSIVKVGYRVGVAWRSFVCGDCQACHAKSENFCERQIITGAGRDGTFARYITFPSNHLVPIPAAIESSAAVCPILCAGVTAYSALRKMNPVAGKWCAIAGAAGGVGHLAIQFAKVAFGLKVVAIDSGDDKAKFCKQMGADAFVDFMVVGKELAPDVRQATDGGADYILILSPIQGAYNDAGEYARFGAQVMAIGIGNCSFPLRPILRKSLVVQSNQTGTREDMMEALGLAAQGKIHSEFEVLELQDLNACLDRVSKGGTRGKLVVKISE